MKLSLYSRWIVLGAALLVAAVLWRAVTFAPVHKGGSGCMAECPAAPSGCERTSVEPGACSDDACSKPAPVCHYAATDAGAVCPPTLAGRCIPPK